MRQVIFEEPKQSLIMDKTILLVMPVLFKKVDGRLGFDDQTCQGLVSWAENFERVIMACPLLTDDEAAYEETSITWQAIDELPCADRVELVPLPYAYKIRDFIKTYHSTRNLLRTKIQSAGYLCFGTGVMIGDWGAIACTLAMELSRPYAVWCDRVEYEVIRRTLKAEPLRRRIKETLMLPVMKRYCHYMISNSQLGLFQGQDCYSVFSPLCKHPHCVYDTHTKKTDLVSDDYLNLKIESVLSGHRLKICYVGRAAEMKGPLDWLNVLHRLQKSGVDFQATWLGDGPLLGKMTALVKELGLTDRVTLAGFVDDRSKILHTIRTSDIFLFCHKTPESPRCLIESLVSGAPIIGYGSAYSQGLVSQHGGGAFVPLNDLQKLSDMLISLNSDRDKLAELIRQAALSGKYFDQETVFRHRSDLIKKYLN